MSRLVQVYAVPPFAVVCRRCTKRGMARPGAEPWYADLDGEAYKAYVCKDCAFPGEHVGINHEGDRT